MEKKKIKFRHEFKHMINKGEEVGLSHRLSKVFSRDSNAGVNGEYKVTSLYFDTPDDKALREKMDGVKLREKFRLRYYNEDLSYIRLEKKSKVNGLSYKIQTRLSQEEVEKIIEKDIGFLLEKEEEIFHELYTKMKLELLRPNYLVTYDREAFVYGPGNVRITLDKNIRTSFDGPGRFLDPKALHYSIDPGITILEVKYDEFLPDIVRLMVNLPQTKASAYSKYAISRRFN